MLTCIRPCCTRISRRLSAFDLNNRLNPSASERGQAARRHINVTTFNWFQFSRHQAPYQSVDRIFADVISQSVRMANVIVNVGVLTALHCTAPMCVMITCNDSSRHDGGV